MPSYPADRVEYLKPNGNIGLDASEEWALRLEPGDGVPGMNLALADIQALPKVEMITRFCCIEGWSVIAHWAGADFPISHGSTCLLTLPFLLMCIWRRPVKTTT